MLTSPRLGIGKACQTAEVVWIEHKDQAGQITHRIPHARRLSQPKEGNKLLKNLEKIREWITEVHLIHEEKEWVGHLNLDVLKTEKKNSTSEAETYWRFPMQ